MIAKRCFVHDLNECKFAPLFNTNIYLNIYKIKLANKLGEPKLIDNGGFRFCDFYNLKYLTSYLISPVSKVLILFTSMTARF